MIEPIFKGRAGFCLASGPSLSTEQIQQIAACAAPKAVGVTNSTWEAVPWADVLYACDTAFWYKRRRKVEAFHGLKFTASLAAANENPALRHIPLKPKGGFSLTPDCLHHGGNSGYQLVNLMIHLGCNPIILLGYDLSYGANGEVHHHGSHPDMRNPADTTLAKWALAFDKTHASLLTLGVTVYNCTPRTRVTAYPRRDLFDVLHELEADNGN